MRPFLLILSLSLLAVAGAAEEAAPRRLAVVTGNTVVHDILLHIAGDHVDAQCLLAIGVDPHTYQPLPEDAR